MIVKTAYDLVPYLDAIEKVKSSSLLTKDQRSQILQEMDKSFIDIVFCQQCPQTHAVIKSIIGETNGSTQKPTTKVAKKRTEVSKKAVPKENNYFTKLMQTEEGRALRKQWSTKKRKNPGRPQGTPDGYTLEAITPIRKQAKADAERIVAIMAKDNEIDDVICS